MYFNLALFGFLIILLSLGTYFSAAEMAFASLNRARIKSLTESPGKRGRRASKVFDLYENHFDETISTLLIGNNLVAITSATVAVLLFTRLLGDIGYFLATVVISAVVIVFTDIIPKSITKEQPENIAIFIIPMLGFFMKILSPLTWSVVKIKNRVSAKIVPKQTEHTEDEQSLLSQELVFMVEEAEKGGTLGEDESHLITNAIEFNDVLAWDIHTPRVNIVSMPITATVDEAAALFLESGHSRIPVYEDSLDKVVGIVHLRDFIKCVVPKGDGSSLAIRDVLTPAIFTVTSARVSDVLTLLKKEKHHMAIIADEYGGTEGLITMEDILEELVGDIWDESDEIIEEFEKLDDGKYKVLGNADIDKLFEIFDIEEESESNTVGGWIMDELRRVPEVGDTFTSGKLVVTVTKADGRRTEECIVELAEDAAEDIECEVNL